LQPLFYVAETYLNGDQIGKQLGGLVTILFQINDRGIRGTLLQKANLFVENFDKSSLNQAVFEPMCSGFSDSSAALRELTLKATLVLVPYLTHPNLEKLSRYLVRLQGDPESSIRTNTVIYFGRLAPYLTDMSREKLLLPAFVRAMKDTFTPCRLQTLKFALQVKQYFEPRAIADKVLPAVTPHLLDPSADVRREAFHVVEDLLLILRQEGDRMDSIVEPSSGSSQQPLTSTQQTPAAPVSAPVAAPAPASSGYLSGLSSWMSSSTKPSAPEPAAPPVPAPPQSTPAAPIVSAPAAAATPNISSMRVDDSWDHSDGDGWGDDLDTSFGGHNSFGAQSNTPASPPPAANNVAIGGSLFAPAPNEDEFFSAFDNKPAKPVAARLMGGTRGKLIVQKKAGTKTAAPKPVVKKLAVNDDDDGWDDF
jgi:SCY1-like protein 1